jgi:hypothetical protein
MKMTGKVALFSGGTLFGTAGLKLLGSRDARKVYSHVTAAALRCKDQVMRDVESVQEGCSDILADAKAINKDKTAEAEAAYIEDGVKV